MFILFSYCSLSGYPKATINGSMATQAAGGEVTSEDLQSNISSVLWQFKEFSNEVGTNMIVIFCYCQCFKEKQIVFDKNNS